jgi:hypothetical protein
MNFFRKVHGVRRIIGCFLYDYQTFRGKDCEDILKLFKKQRHRTSAYLVNYRGHPFKRFLSDLFIGIRDIL